MFTKSEIEVKLDEEITALLKAMSQMEKLDEKYESTVDQLSKLYEMRQKNRISMDTLVTVGAHLVGIIAIMQHERVNVIASKAFGLVKKIF